MRLQTLIEEFYHAYVELQARTTRRYTAFSVHTSADFAFMRLEWEEGGEIYAGQYSVSLGVLREWVRTKQQRILYYQVFDCFEVGYSDGAEETADDPTEKGRIA